MFDIKLEYAEKLLHEGRLIQARNLLSGIVAKDPYNVQAVLFLADAYTFMQRPGYAIKCYRVVLKKMPFHPGIWQNLGWAYSTCGDVRAGDTIMRNALDGFPYTFEELERSSFCYGPEYGVSACGKRFVIPTRAEDVSYLEDSASVIDIDSERAMLLEEIDSMTQTYTPSNEEIAA